VSTLSCVGSEQRLSIGSAVPCCATVRPSSIRPLDGFAGSALIERLRRMGGICPALLTPRDIKTVRLRRMSALLGRSEAKPWSSERPLRADSAPSRAMAGRPTAPCHRRSLRLLIGWKARPTCASHQGLPCCMCRPQKWKSSVAGSSMGHLQVRSVSSIRLMRRGRFLDLLQLGARFGADVIGGGLRRQGRDRRARPVPWRRAVTGPGDPSSR
jgi:hypothetical protein